MTTRKIVLRQMLEKSVDERVCVKYFSLKIHLFVNENDRKGKVHSNGHAKYLICPNTYLKCAWKTAV